MDNRTAKSLKIFLVEDSVDVRARLADMLGAVDGVEIVGEADNPATASSGILATLPDCVVLDFQLIGGTGVEVLRRVHPAAPHITFIVLSNYAQPQYRKVCESAGASWYLDKSEDFERVRDLVRGMTLH